MCGKLTKMLKKYNAENSKRLEEALMSDEDTGARVAEDNFEDARDKRDDINRPVNILIALDKAITANLGANFNGEIKDVKLCEDGDIGVWICTDSKDEKHGTYYTRCPIEEVEVGKLLELRGFIETKLK